MKITIIAVGKMSGAFSKQYGEYAKRLKYYVKLECIEVEVKGKSDEGAQNRLENEKILQKLDALKNPFVIALEPAGKSFTTEKISQKFEDFRRQGRDLVLLIGGSSGLNRKVIEACDLQWSFSDLTFPHQLFRVMLIEQIYRIHTVIRGESYHKSGKME